ncbi:unnamed protein product [Somion occarium]|uniref:Alpha/beta-hydrolase n=1 Tax=Somion occarium TaxID=3059160 RepID=A0ABP1D6G4_9APHY
MPFVDLVSKEDYASLWYYTNSPYNNVGDFKPERPTIVMLHPFIMDSTWCYPQLDDPRLNENYNIVILDTRLTGKSVCKFSGKYDLWVAAADIAHAFHHLRLPAAHIFASEVFVLVALRLAILFPELCLSLTLCNVPPEEERKDVLNSLDDILSLWCHAQDLATFEHANRDLLEFAAGKRLGKAGGGSPQNSISDRNREAYRDVLGSLGSAERHLASAHADKLVEVELEDELVSFWQTTYPPFRRSYLMSFIQTFCHDRIPLTADELAQIEMPVMIMQAANNALYPVKYAEALRKKLVGVPNGAMLQLVHGRVGFITLVRSSIVNQLFSKFLATLERPGPHDECAASSLKFTMSRALQRLSLLKKDPSMRQRDVLTPLSFSCCDDETAQKHIELVKSYAKGQRSAFSPLGADGRPIRKFSERKDHWLSEEDLDGQDEVRRESFHKPPAVWVDPPPSSDEKDDVASLATFSISRRSEYSSGSTIEKVPTRSDTRKSVQKQLIRLLR